MEHFLLFCFHLLGGKVWEFILMFFNDRPCSRRFKSAVSADFHVFSTPRRHKWVLKQPHIYSGWLLHYCSGCFQVCSRELKFPQNDEASVQIIPDGKRIRRWFTVGCSIKLLEHCWTPLGKAYKSYMNIINICCLNIGKRIPFVFQHVQNLLICRSSSGHTGIWMDMLFTHVLISLQPKWC